MQAAGVCKASYSAQLASFQQPHTRAAKTKSWRNKMSKRIRENTGVIVSASNQLMTRLQFGLERANAASIGAPLLLQALPALLSARPEAVTREVITAVLEIVGPKGPLRLLKAGRTEPKQKGTKVSSHARMQQLTEHTAVDSAAGPDP
jgi:hypothetical protein